jgi:N-acetylmuramoyl-L-alanine amidase
MFISMKKIPLLVIAGFTFIIISCSNNPYKSTNKSYNQQVKTYSNELRKIPPNEVNDSMQTPGFFVGTTNFNLRKPNFVIIHHTAQKSCEETLNAFTRKTSNVSAHYVICKDGTVHHMLNDYLRAWQAGRSKWGSLTDINSSSIGIEIDNTGFEAFTDEQISSLLRLLTKLKKMYSIPAANFIGHGDIAPGRKVDPNINFPWKKLSEQGFGLWYDEVRDSVPSDFNSIIALRLVGYDTKDTTAAIHAFKRHFMQDTSGVMSETDKSVLNNLQKKW